MDRPKCILFDYGGTLMSGTFNPIEGNRAILKNATNPHGITPEGMQELADKLDREILILKNASLLESTAYSFQRLLYDLLGVRVNGTPEQVELIFWDAAMSMAPTPQIPDVLAELRKLDIILGVLSNMTFSGKTIARELNKHHLDRYFNVVAASSDYGFRKPAKLLFDAVIKKAGCRPEQAWYVGDSVDADVVGAAGAGMYPIWYNPNRVIADLPVPCLEIHEWRQLLTAVEQCTLTAIDHV
jgi:putative hydrolase of the HAD superfamily